MSLGFYELIGVAPDADVAAIRAAYQGAVAQLVRKQRAAEARAGEVAPLEARRAALVEAFAVLADPARRRQYDRLRELGGGLPTDLDELWRVAGPSLVHPAASAALEVVRTLTSLRVGDPLGTDVATAEEPEVELELETTVPADAPVVAAPPRTAAPRSRSAAVAPIDRSVDAAEVNRLLDVYGPTGAYLRALREARRLDLDGLSTATKVARRYLEAMEAEKWELLPAAIFVRGYLRMIARALEVPGTQDDTDELVEGYMARFHRARG